MGHYLSNRLFHRCGVYPLAVDAGAAVSEAVLFKICLTLALGLFVGAFVLSA
jgi:hypothetical protein